MGSGRGRWGRTRGRWGFARGILGGRIERVPDEHAHGRTKKPCRPQTRQYHQTLTCPPSASWWNVFPTGALRYFNVEERITPCRRTRSTGLFCSPSCARHFGVTTPAAHQRNSSPLFGAGDDRCTVMAYGRGECPAREFGDRFDPFPRR